MFRGVEQLMGSTVAAQDLLLRSPASFGCGIERLAINLRALQQLYGCSLQQAQRVLLRTPHLTPLKVEASKFQCRVAALTEWWDGSTRRPSGLSWRASSPVEHSRINRHGWTARQLEQQRLAITGASVSSSGNDGTAAQRLLQLSQQYDTLAVDDRNFHHQLTAEERLARIQMLLQQGITEEIVQRMIEHTKGGPYMQSASMGAAVLAVLRERGCSDAEIDLLLRWQPNILGRAAGSISNVFAALDDMLQLSRPQILKVCLSQPSLLTRDSDMLRQRWAWVQEHYGLSEAAAASLAKRMVNSRAVCSLLLLSQDTVTARLAGMQRLFMLSDAEVNKLFPYLAELLVADPEQHIRPRWNLLQDVFSGVEQLMGSTAAAQSLLRRSPKSFACGIKRLATNLSALQQLYGCSEQQAQKVLLRAAQLAPLKLEAPKFQCRVAALTEWYGHASPAAMLLAPSSGRRLCASLWVLGPRMAFIRRLRLERAESDLNTSALAIGTEGFCRAVGVSEEEYAAFEQRWLASPEAAELCRHEGPPRMKVIGEMHDAGPFPGGGKKLRRDVRVEDVYSLGKLLGTGGSSSVLLATDRSTGQEWACKIMALPRAGSELRAERQGRDRVLREISAMLDLEHPCVIGLREYFVQDQKAYLVMELSRGGEMLDAVNDKGHYSEDEARTAFLRVLQGVQYLHSSGVVHRDLKLENLLLARPGDISSVKIADFGGAVKGSPAVLNDIQTMCGSPQYVAPEVLLGRHGSSALGSQAPQPYGPGCDVWSCGVVLYMLLSGCPPFWHEDVEQLLAAVQRGKFDFEDPVWRGVRREANDLISGLLQFDPEQRPSCDEALQHPWLRTSDGAQARGVAEGQLLLGGAKAGTEGGERGTNIQRTLGVVLLAVMCLALYFIVVRCLASAMSGPAQVVSQLIECSGAHAPSTATLGLAADRQQRLWQSGAATGPDLATSTKPSSSAAQRLLQLSQQYDTLAVGDRNFDKQLTAEERLARIEMLLQQGVTEETVQRIIERTKGGPYMQSANEGAAVLAVLHEHGCLEAEINLLLRWKPNISQRAASSISDVFAALDDMLQLSRPQILRVCLRQPSLPTSSSDTLRQRWAWLQAHYGLSEATMVSLAKRMVSSRAVCSLLTYSQDTITARLAGLQRVFELSDAEVSKLFPYLAVLLEADPERHIRPRWNLLQSLLGEFQPADKRRFITSSGALRLPKPTIRAVFSGVEQLMSSTVTAQDLLRRSPKSFICGIERLVTNLRALQQLYGCSLQQAPRVLLRTPKLAPLMLEAPKFQCRVAALTQWYGHASPAAMLLAPNHGSQLGSSMWKLGARMAFIRRLRLERAAPGLNTSQLVGSAKRFCREVQVSEEEYAAFEQRWLASPEAAALCCHEGPPHASLPTPSRVMQGDAEAMLRLWRRPTSPPSPAAAARWLRRASSHAARAPLSAAALALSSSQAAAAASSDLARLMAAPHQPRSSTWGPAAANSNPGSTHVQQPAASHSPGSPPPHTLTEARSWAPAAAEPSPKLAPRPGTLARGSGGSAGSWGGGRQAVQASGNTAEWGSLQPQAHHHNAEEQVAISTCAAEKGAGWQVPPRPSARRAQHSTAAATCHEAEELLAVQAGSNSPGHGFQQPPQQPQQAGAACLGRHTIVLPAEIHAFQQHQHPPQQQLQQHQPHSQQRPGSAQLGGGNGTNSGMDPAAAAASLHGWPPAAAAGGYATESMQYAEQDWQQLPKPQQQWQEQPPPQQLWQEPQQPQQLWHEQPQPQQQWQEQAQTQQQWQEQPQPQQQWPGNLNPQQQWQQQGQGPLQQWQEQAQTQQQWQEQPQPQQQWPGNLNPQQKWQQQGQGPLQQWQEQQEQPPQWHEKPQAQQQWQEQPLQQQQWQEQQGPHQHQRRALQPASPKPDPNAAVLPSVGALLPSAENQGQAAAGGGGARSAQPKLRQSVLVGSGSFAVPPEPTEPSVWNTAPGALQPANKQRTRQQQKQAQPKQKPKPKQPQAAKSGTRRPGNEAAAIFGTAVTTGGGADSDLGGAAAQPPPGKKQRRTATPAARGSGGTGGAAAAAAVAGRAVLGREVLLVGPWPEVVDAISSEGFARFTAEMQQAASYSIGLLSVDGTGSQFHSTLEPPSKTQLQSIKAAVVAAAGGKKPRASGKGKGSAAAAAAPAAARSGGGAAAAGPAAAVAAAVAASAPVALCLLPVQEDSQTGRGVPGATLFFLPLAEGVWGGHEVSEQAAVQGRDMAAQLLANTDGAVVLAFNMQGVLRQLHATGVAVPAPQHLTLADPRLLAWLLEPQLLQGGEKEITDYDLWQLAERHLPAGGTPAAAAAPDPAPGPAVAAWDAAVGTGGGGGGGGGGPLHRMHLALSAAVQLGDALYAQLSGVQVPMEAAQLEMQMAALLAEMEQAGLGFDPWLLRQGGQVARDRMAAIEQVCEGLAGRPFNLASPSQLAEVLYNVLKLPPPATRGRASAKTHLPTDEPALEALKPLSPVPALVLQYRGLLNFTSKWVDADWCSALAGGYPSPEAYAAAHPASGGWPRVHCCWHQTSTATGRLSSSAPNLQAITKYQVEAAGAQELMELRVLAHLSGDPALLALLQQAGTAGDAFKHIAARWLGSGDVDRVSEEERQKAKCVTYGIIYGQTAYGLSQTSRPLAISVNAAKGLIASFLAHFKGVAAFIETTKAAARAQGGVCTMAGRRRPIPGLASQSSSERAEGERKAVNTTIQGSAADLMKQCMLNWRAWQESQGMPHARIVAQLHDELLVEVDSTKLSVACVAQELRRVMESVVQLRVPLVVKISAGERWGSMAAVE
ncbi:putative myosin light chain kinase [Chlorella vulgaris]